MDPITLSALAGTLLKVGPGLIRGIGSLFGDKTARVADTVAGITEAVGGQGGAPASQQNKVAQALTALPPEQLLELKAMQQELENQAARIEAEREARQLQHEETLSGQHLADVQQARQQHRDHWMPSALTLALFVMMSGVTWALFNWGIPDSNRDLVVYIGGQIAGFFATAVGYWLGSSRSSKEKDQRRFGYGAGGAQ